MPKKENFRNILEKVNNLLDRNFAADSSRPGSSLYSVLISQGVDPNSKEVSEKPEGRHGSWSSDWVAASQYIQETPGKETRLSDVWKKAQDIAPDHPDVLDALDMADVQIALDNLEVSSRPGGELSYNSENYEVLNSSFKNLEVSGWLDPKVASQVTANVDLLEAMASGKANIYSVADDAREMCDKYSEKFPVKKGENDPKSQVGRHLFNSAKSFLRAFNVTEFFSFEAMESFVFSSRFESLVIKLSNEPTRRGVGFLETLSAAPAI